MSIFKIHISSRKKASVFTLIEVVLAIAVMAIGTSALFIIASSATTRYNESQIRWARQHLMNNACEFFLLCGPDAKIPNDLLPSNYQATCEVTIYEDKSPDAEMPDFAFESNYSNWYLGAYTVRLFDEKATLIGEQIIEKVIRDDE
ncbi:MAG: type II secretion system protein [Lentisphaeria bacterium]